MLALVVSMKRILTNGSICYIFVSFEVPTMRRHPSVALHRHNTRCCWPWSSTWDD